MLVCRGSMRVHDREGYNQTASDHSGVFLCVVFVEMALITFCHFGQYRRSRKRQNAKSALADPLNKGDSEWREEEEKTICNRDANHCQPIRDEFFRVFSFEHKIHNFRLFAGWLLLSCWRHGEVLLTPCFASDGGKRDDGCSHKISHTVTFSTKSELNGDEDKSWKEHRCLSQVICMESTSNWHSFCPFTKIWK